MEVLFWLLVILALAKIGQAWAMKENGKALVEAKVRLEELKLQEKREQFERKMSVAEGKVAKTELRKQIKLIENLLPLKQFDRHTLKNMPRDVRKAIYSQLGLDELVVEAYLKMTDEQIERVKVGL